MFSTGHRGDVEYRGWTYNLISRRTWSLIGPLQLEIDDFHTVIYGVVVIYSLSHFPPHTLLCFSTHTNQLGPELQEGGSGLGSRGAVQQPVPFLSACVRVQSWRTRAWTPCQGCSRASPSRRLCASGALSTAERTHREPGVMWTSMCPRRLSPRAEGWRSRIVHSPSLVRRKRGKGGRVRERRAGGGGRGDPAGTPLFAAGHS